MSDQQQPGRDEGRVHEIRVYRIRVTGHLADRWAGWFDGMTVHRQADGSTVLEGGVVDQAALHGLLRKVSDLGLPLVSVTPTDQPEPRSTP